MRNAFSLVELSIVLVILGLLTGGILAGQSLIRSAELRAISTEYGKHVSAMHSFRDKYFALPGDFAKAYQFWGAPCGTNDNQEIGGCNGDGDGVIRAYGAEDARAWKHLAYAGLIEGTYSTATSFIIATNGPGNTGLISLSPESLNKSKMGNAYWLFTDLWRLNSCYNCNANYSSTILTLGGQNGLELGPIQSLSLAEAWNLDTKMDDGRAGSGMIHGTDNSICIDASANDPYSLAARGAETKNACQLHFIYQK